jgi:tetratricopeptide (TPR) repeat protein
MALGRMAEAQKAFQQPAERKLDDDIIHTDLYGLAFVQQDAKTMAEQVAWFSGRPELEHEILALQSDTAAFVGHLTQARELTERAVQSAVRADNKAAAAMWELDSAWREAFFGYPKESQRQAELALATAPDSPDAQELGAILLARVGDTNRAQSLAQDLVKHFPVHTLVRTYWLPAMQAQIAMTGKDTNKAIEQLQVAAPLDLAQAGFAVNGSCLYGAYVRGEAYLAARRGSAAAPEFQKIIDHPGVVWNCATGTMAHLELGRAYAMAGDFLALWKDADPDIPTLKEAKAEYAKLQWVPEHVIDPRPDPS